jgi:hypothetical protein
VPTTIGITGSDARKTSKGDSVMTKTEDLGSPYVYTHDYPPNPTYFDADIDTRAQRIYEYLDTLWGNNGKNRKAIVKDLLDFAQEPSKNGKPPQEKLRKLLAEPPLRLVLPHDVDYAVIDLETGEMATLSKADKKSKLFYMLMLPSTPKDPKEPKDPKDKSYDIFKASQQWTEAFYHAVRQSGGM